MNNSSLGNIRALKEYTKVNVQTGIEHASPHRLIQMLIDGALAKLAQAKGHIKANNIAEKGKDLSTAISIIGGLRDSLDHDKGGSIANNLEDLYEYMTYRLMESNLKNDVQIIDEVHGLLMEIKSAWDGIANQEKSRPQTQNEIEPAA
jgi:flagellar secretion chaperone FliS